MMSSLWSKLTYDSFAAKFKLTGRVFIFFSVQHIFQYFETIYLKFPLSSISEQRFYSGCNK